MTVNGDHAQVVISQAGRDSTTYTLSASWWTRRRRVTGLIVGGATVLGTAVAVAVWVGWFPFTG